MDTFKELRRACLDFRPVMPVEAIRHEPVTVFDIHAWFSATIWLHFQFVLALAETKCTSPAKAERKFSSAASCTVQAEASCAKPCTGPVGIVHRTPHLAFMSSDRRSPNSHAAMTHISVQACASFYFLQAANQQCIHLKPPAPRVSH